MTQMKADLADTYFAWSGPTNAESGTNITAYYRIQGPHLVIEYARKAMSPETTSIRCIVIQRTTMAARSSSHEAEAGRMHDGGPAAAFACIASAMWIAERLLNVETHVDAIVNVIAQRGVMCAGILLPRVLHACSCARAKGKS